VTLIDAASGETLSPQEQNQRMTRLVCIMGSLVCALLLFSASLPAFAGARIAASCPLTRSTTTRAGAADPSNPFASATADAPVLRVGRAGAHLSSQSAGPQSSVSSLNWAGYDVTTGGPTSVTATWVTPAITAPSTALSYASFWVGLDGDGSATAEQTGIAASVRNGRVAYYAWYEMYPAAEVPIAGLTVSAGDLMTATVTTDGSGRFTLAVADRTTQRSFTTTQTGPATPPASAEIVAEAPTDASVGGLLPLAGFGTVDFTGCAIDGRPVVAFTRNQIAMVAHDGATLAAASSLSSDGTSFAVSQTTGDVTAPTTTASGADDLWHNKPVTVTLTAADAPGGSGVARTEYKIDGGPWTAATSLTVSAPSDHTNDGSHAVLYRSIDGAGNAETPRVCTVDIDTCPPRPLADRAATVTRGRTAILAYSVSETCAVPATADVTIKIKTPAGRLVTTLKRHAAALNTRLVARFACRLAAGRYRFSIYATDAAGNAQSSVGSNSLTVR
jgi:hypothetical protein